MVVDPRSRSIEQKVEHEASLPSLSDHFPNPVAVAEHITSEAVAVANQLLDSGDVHTSGERRYVTRAEQRKLGKGLLNISETLVSGPQFDRVEQPEDFVDLTNGGSTNHRTGPGGFSPALTGYKVVTVNSGLQSKRPIPIFRDKKSPAGANLVYENSMSISTPERGPATTEPGYLETPSPTEIINPTILTEQKIEDGEISTNTVRVGKTAMGSVAVEVVKRNAEVGSPNVEVEVHRSSSAYVSTDEKLIEDAKKAEQMALEITSRVLDAQPKPKI